MGENPWPTNPVPSLWSRFLAKQFVSRKAGAWSR